MRLIKIIIKKIKLIDLIASLLKGAALVKPGETEELTNEAALSKKSIKIKCHFQRHVLRWKCQPGTNEWGGALLVWTAARCCFDSLGELNTSVVVEAAECRCLLVNPGDASRRPCARREDGAAAACGLFVCVAAHSHTNIRTRTIWSCYAEFNPSAGTTGERQVRIKGVNWLLSPEAEAIRVFQSPTITISSFLRPPARLPAAGSLDKVNAIFTMLGFLEQLQADAHGLLSRTWFRRVASKRSHSIIFF